MTAITVTELYRHPVKSMTPEPVSSVELTEDGRVKGDRVLGFRFNNAGDPGDWAWQTKRNFVGLVNTPALAQLTVNYDAANRRLSMAAGDLLISEGPIDLEVDRRKLAQDLTDFVLTLDENPLDEHPERQPAVLVGDGEQPLFHDSETGLVSLHSEESVKALGESLDDHALNGRRFRSNIVISRVRQPFEEQSWTGRKLRIGDTEFEVLEPLVRCLVTHANPATGQRDHDVMGTLVKHFTPGSPQFSISLRAVSGSRKINVGDEITLAS